MKRFISIDHQAHPYSENKEFAFYCTTKGIIESFDGENVWDLVEDFIHDYKKNGGLQLDRYLGLIPEEYKNQK